VTRLFAGFLNSIAARVMALLLSAVMASLIFILLLMQTPFANQWFNFALSENASSMAELVWLIESSPVEIEGYVLSAYESGSRVARIEPSFGERLGEDKSKAELITASLSDVSGRLEGRDIRFRTWNVWEMRRVLIDQEGPPINAASIQQVAIVLEDGRVLNIWLAPTVSFTQRPAAALLLLAIIFGITVIMGIAVSWVITRPIKVLERDAEQVGLADTSVPVTETGPRELQRLSAALNRMRRRLGGLIREREEIVVAIAHDIRTGITRLKLRMEDRLGEGAEPFEGDMVLMEQLVSDMLAYSRAENPLVDPELIELGSFMQAIVKASPLGLAVHDEAVTTPFTIAGSRLALHRLFENLIENARRYGGGAITVRLEQNKRGYCICIEDDGPGMPEEELAQAFKPFFRGEGSRNRATGGSGLGLGIASAIANTHGAQLSLQNRTSGGLRASVLFPVELSN